MLTVAVVAAAAVAAAQVGLSVGIAGAHVDGFRVRVTTGKQVYPQGEPVEATLRVCRTSLLPATTPGGGGTDLPAQFRILDADGNVVADSSHEVRTGDLRTVYWFPGQCRRVHLRWDQHYWNRPGDDPPPGVAGVPARGQTVPAGEYTIEMTWSSVVAVRGFEIAA